MATPVHVSNRQMRRAVGAQQTALRERIVPALQATLVELEAAQGRIAKLEAVVQEQGLLLGRIAKLEAVVQEQGLLLSRGFFGRLRWLVRGQ